MSVNPAANSLFTTVGDVLGRWLPQEEGASVSTHGGLAQM